MKSLRQTANREKEKVNNNNSNGGVHWCSEACKLFQSRFQMLETRVVESESRSRKDFQPEESEL